MLAHKMMSFIINQLIDYLIIIKQPERFTKSSRPPYPLNKPNPKGPAKCRVQGVKGTKFPETQMTLIGE